MELDPNFYVPTYEQLFKDFTYESQMLVLGAKRSGKTNFLIWFYLYCPARMVFWNSTGKLEIERLSHVILNESDIWIGKFKRALDDNRLKKICITVSDKVSENEDTLLQVWDKVCSEVFYHEDKEYTRQKRLQGKKLDRDFRRKANIILLNDEVMQVSKDGMNMQPKHELACNQGGNYNVSLLSAFQRHQGVPKKLTTMSEHKIIFYTVPDKYKLYNNVIKGITIKYPYNILYWLSHGRGIIDEYDRWALWRKVSGVKHIGNLPRYHFLHQDPYGGIKFYKPVGLMLEPSDSEIR